MSLEPPAEPMSNKADPGASELSNEESSDDHFSDAEEAHKVLSPPMSPIPVTRVERVDDFPAYGEVPGTAAYEIRTQDAVPDELEIIPDGQRSRSTSRLSESDRPLTPGGTPVPKMIVERVDDKPAHGEVPGTAAYDMRKADAEPDEIRQAPQEASQTLEGMSNLPIPDPQHTNLVLTKEASPTSHDRSESITLPEEATILSILPIRQQKSIGLQESIDDARDDQTIPEQESIDDEQNKKEEQEAFNDDDAFGDDFDDFEEGAEAGQDDFDDFDDGFEQPEPLSDPVPVPEPEPVQDPLAHLPNISFADFQTPEDILRTISPHIRQIFPELDNLPQSEQREQQQPTSPTSIIAFSQANPILTDRSASLWSQLVAPPPLQPPNWIRSRIRRLFLVSLGVPVDLDEILPASKQKKLILPNIFNLETNTGTLSRGDNSISKSRNDDDPSNTSIDAASASGAADGSKKKKKDTPAERRGPPPPPPFDANAASLLSSTTEAAMSGYSDEELKAHVARLESLIASASEVLEYWVRRKESAEGDKEAFEGVIENLVGFVRKNRDSRIFK